MGTTKLDRVIEGVRYRSRKPFAASPYRTQYNHGVRQVRVWPCRDVMVLESDSQWDDGTGACVGTTYRVLDPQTPSGLDDLQRLADNWSGYCDGDRDPEAEIQMIIARFAPVAPGASIETMEAVGRAKEAV